MMRNPWIVLAGFVLLCLAVGGVAGALTASSVTTWFPTLVKPSFNPPSWLFAPVWTTLYILMAVAAWRVWRKVATLNGALGWFYVQLFLNFMWSFLFFSAHMLLGALIEIVVMWLAIAITLRAFWKIDRPAGWMLVPYLAWVSFATVLNASLWWLN
jgi:translocator protein